MANSLFHSGQDLADYTNAMTGRDLLQKTKSSEDGEMLSLMKAYVFHHHQQKIRYKLLKKLRRADFPQDIFLLLLREAAKKNSTMH